VKLIFVIQRVKSTLIDISGGSTFQQELVISADSKLRAVTRDEDLRSTNSSFSKSIGQ